MAAEAAVTSQRKKSPLTSHGSRNGSSGDASHDQAPRLPDAVYRTLLGIDRNLKRHPSKYNVGQIALEPQSGFENSLYAGRDLQSLEDVLTAGNVETGVPYIATGYINFDDEGTAFLDTVTTSIALGRIGAHAQRMFTTDKDLAGREVTLPVVIDEINEDEARGRPGDQAAYLIPNPDWLTRGRLGKLGAQGVIEGLVRKIDHESKERMGVQTKDGGLFSRRSINVRIGREIPLLDGGTDERPTDGEALHVNDRVRIPVLFAGRRAILDGNSSLVEFSKEHARSYEARKQTVESKLDALDSMLNDSNPQPVMRPDGSLREISDPDERAAVARYLYAEIRQQIGLLTQDKQYRLWELVFSMDESVRPIIFEEGDPMREAFDKYFRENDAEGGVPRLVEALTPQQLLGAMIYMSAHDSYPPRMEHLMGTIEKYQEQFDQGASLDLIHTVVATRESDMRSGNNPEAAIYSLTDVLSYLREQEPAYAAEWFAHIIYAGKSLAASDPDQWNNSFELRNLMQLSLDGLKSVVYQDEKYLHVNHDALSRLFMYIQFIRQWPNELPYGIGADGGLAFVLRDLEIMSLAQEEERIHSHQQEQNQTEDRTSLEADQLPQLVSV